MGKEHEFIRAMFDIYITAKRECKYNPERFRQMVDVQGGVDAAKSLLSKSDVSDGFGILYEQGRLDLTVEALVLKSDFKELFTGRELEEARQRLRECRFNVDDWELNN